ncbi:MAG: nucleotidyltransferase [Peptococcaceae bacterium]|nr:nucleotidyltransferase [Peptococcaceae bacterium]
MDKIETKLSNFQNALQRLKEADQEYKKEGSSDVVRDGLIQRFEFSYELAWKTTKLFLEDLGIVDVNSPKAVIKEAYAQKLVDDEKNWLLILSDRNKTSHLYQEALAKEIAERISNCYIYEFELLLKKLNNTKY